MNICAAITRGWCFPRLLFFFSLYSYAILLVPVVIGAHRPRSLPDQSGAIAVVVFFFYHAGAGAAGA